MLIQLKIFSKSYFLLEHKTFVWVCIEQFKISFRRLMKNAIIYINNEKCFLNNKFAIQKEYKPNSLGILNYNLSTN